MAPNPIILEQGTDRPETPGIVIWTKDGKVTSTERRFVDVDRPEEGLMVGEKSHYLFVSPDHTVMEALQILADDNVDTALVTTTPLDKTGKSIVGVVTATELASTMKSAAKLQ
jgi:chloride channel protein, CIC family